MFTLITAKLCRIINYDIINYKIVNCLYNILTHNTKSTEMC